MTCSLTSTALKSPHLYHHRPSSPPTDVYYPRTPPRLPVANLQHHSISTSISSTVVRDELLMQLVHFSGVPTFYREVFELVILFQSCCRLLLFFGCFDGLAVVDVGFGCGGRAPCCCHGYETVSTVIKRKTRFEWRSGLVGFPLMSIPELWNQLKMSSLRARRPHSDICDLRQGSSTDDRSDI